MSAEAKPDPIYYFHGGKVYVTEDNPLFTGVKPLNVNLKTEVPVVRWKGAKIPFHLWASICSFMRWSQKTHKDEAMVTLFYNTELNDWSAWAFAQRGVGMTVNYIPEHHTVKDDRAQFRKGWIQFGSVHHHCTASAFASGTDRTDEEKKEGVHFTLGKVDQPVAEIHCRQVLCDLVQDVRPMTWLAAPDWIKHIPSYVQADTVNHALKCVDGVDFPDVWKERIIKNAPFVYQGQGTHTSPPKVNGAGVNGPQPSNIGSEIAAASGKTAPEDSEYFTQRCVALLAVLDENQWDFDLAYDLIVDGYTSARPVMTEDERTQRWAMLKAIDDKAGIPNLYATIILKSIHKTRQKPEAQNLREHQDQERLEIERSLADPTGCIALD
jgi:hypothetical protein